MHMEKITAWRTEDGQTFADKQLAIDNAMRLALKRIIGGDGAIGAFELVANRGAVLEALDATPNESLTQPAPLQPKAKGGDILLCVDGCDRLSKGREYRARDILGDDRVVLIDDNEGVGIFPLARFHKLSETPA